MKFILHAFNLNYNHPAIKPHEPARFVSLRLRIEMMVYKLPFFVGLIFFVGGTFMFILWFLITDFASIVFGRDVHTVTAKIISIKDAKYTENEVSYFEYAYVYLLNGHSYKNSSYAKRNHFKEGDIIQIEYEKNSPSISRIRGMRMSPGPIWALLFLLIFPVIGASVIIGVVYYVFRSVLYIRHGIVVESVITGRIKLPAEDSESTETSDIYVEFKTKDGKNIETKINISASVKGRVGQHAIVVYLPWDPYAAVFLNEMELEAKAIIRSI